jgi:hypothetical protein
MTTRRNYLLSCTEIALRLALEQIENCMSAYIEYFGA